MSSGLAWEKRYHGDWGYGAEGLHIFNAEREVHRGSQVGIVLSRTALTAVVRWNNGSKETIEQFDEEVFVCPKRQL